jgi:RNA polymerase sigma factor (sigma-70 family)
MNNAEILNKHIDGALLFKHEVASVGSDTALWNAFRNGNQKAFEQLFDSHIKALYSYGVRFTSDKSVVQDAIHDLYVYLWDKRETLGEVASIKHYLFQCLRRRIIKMLSHTKKMHNMLAVHVSLHEEEIEFSCEFLIIEQETDQQKKEKLKLALEQLTKRQKEAVISRGFPSSMWLPC